MNPNMGFLKDPFRVLLNHQQAFREFLFSRALTSNLNVHKSVGLSHVKFKILTTNKSNWTHYKRKRKAPYTEKLPPELIEITEGAHICLQFGINQIKIVAIVKQEASRPDSSAV